MRYPGESDADVLLTLRDVTEERRLSQVKSDFVSNASHELRTPLTNIRGYLEAIRDAVREGAAPESSFVEVALGNALRMERLIDDLLELSRAESGAVPLEKEETSLSAFLAPGGRPAPSLRAAGGKNRGGRGERRCVTGRSPETCASPLEPGRKRPEIREGTGTRHPLGTDRGGCLPHRGGR